MIGGGCGGGDDDFCCETLDEPTDIAGDGVSVVVGWAKKEFI